MKRFINCLIPVSACNLKCEYCYVPHVNGRKQNKMPVFEYDAKHIRKALSKERLGGVSLFNFCGEGETLLPKEVVCILKEILDEGHYVELVTNMTLTDRIDEILNWDETLLSHLEFKCSFHYKELIRTNQLELFISNVKKVINSKASVTVELVPDDSLVDDIPKIKDICYKNFGALCHLTVPRDERVKTMKILTSQTNENFYKVWNDSFDSDMFKFKYSTFNVKRREFCYAGEWALFLNLANGETKQCYKSFYTQNIFNDLSKPINFKPVGCFCLSPHCFNAHALMTLGLIPDMDTPAYSEMRNRVCTDGSEWLKPEIKAVMQQKLYNENSKFTKGQKICCNIKNVLYAPFGYINQKIKKRKK